MNLKHYYRDVAAIEESIEEPFVMVVSLETKNGGKAGVMTEVSRETAARLVVEKRARLAMPDEVEQMRADQELERQLRELGELEERVRIARAAEAELDRLKESIAEAYKRV